MKGTLKLLGATARLFALLVVILVANLTALYIAAGVAFRGDWDRVDNAVERAYDEFLNN